MGNPNVQITNCGGKTANLDSTVDLSDVLTGGATYASAIQIVNEAVLDVATVDASDIGGGSLGLGTFTLPAGLFIQGHFTEIKVTSGVVRAYLA